jgi:ATP-dependent Lhr-like helicase
LIPKTAADLLEQAVLAREMAAGRVEEIRVPSNCLDVLAQQIVAMAAMDDWNVQDLYMLVRRAYPYCGLTPQVFEAVLEMVSGRYRWPLQSSMSKVQGRKAEETGLGPGTLTALQPRVSWDRVHNRVLSLPGSKHLAVVNGGTIPDTGQFAAYTPAGLRIGELDEEFIYERRVGEAFLLGTNAWKLEKIEADRVIVSPAQGAPAMVPFWRGEKTGRSYDLGQAIGRFLRELAKRIDDTDCLDWLQSKHFLDLSAAKNLCLYVRRQLAKTGCLPTDRTLVIEACRDHLGDWQVVVLSPLGSRLHFGLRLALEARLANRLGYRAQCLHHDDGILIRLVNTEEPILDFLDGLTPENVEELILSELTESALFALRFRQNAARALLMPRGRPGKRAPLWLQRLRSRDLLQVARQFPDFPIVAETIRECLHDHLDLPHLKELLAGIRSGQVQIVSRRAETPSPFSGSLLFAYSAAFMYQYDAVEPGPGDSRATLDRQLLEQLINPDRHGPLVDPRAVDQVEHRLRGLGRPPRSPTEMAEWLRRLGDLSLSELHGPMAAFLENLEADGRARRLALPGCRETERWVLTEEAHLYITAFEGKNNDEADTEAAAKTILHRFLNTHALVGLADVLDRYPFDLEWARQQLEHWTQTGQAVPIPPETASESWQWASTANLHQVQRSTLAILRHEVSPCPPHQFADFLLRWQRLHPASRQKGAQAFAATLDRLEGLSLPADLWEHTVFPSRIPDYQSRWLDESIASGEWVWAAEEDGSVAFWKRENLSKVRSPYLLEGTEQPEITLILEVLQQRGASFVSELAKQTSLAPSTVRKALWTLVRCGQVSNDRFDVIRKGEAYVLLNGGQRGASRGLARRGLSSPDGRWWLVPWGQPSEEENAAFMVELLLRRYGIVTRETALLASRMPPWRVLYQVLSRMEMAGRKRRGYFVEGLSGVQFALPDAIRQLQDCAVFPTGEPVILVHGLDPANLFGSSGLLKIPGHDNDNQAFHRRPGNWLVLKTGRPILLIEQHGKRLITPASAEPGDLPQAVACLPRIFHAGRGSGHRHKITVEEWNGKPVTASSGRALLEAAGFVRDYQGMTLYAAWS